jgi:hypothetical protein
MIINSSTLGEMELTALEYNAPFEVLIRLAGDVCDQFSEFLGDRVKVLDHYSCRVTIPTASGYDLKLTFAVRFSPPVVDLEILYATLFYSFSVKKDTTEVSFPSTVNEGQRILLRKALILLIKGAKVNLEQALKPVRI